VLQRRYTMMTEVDSTLAFLVSPFVRSKILRVGIPLFIWI